MTEKEFTAWITASLLSEDIKQFPGEFLQQIETIEVILPGKTLVMGEEFFGKFEIIAVDGTPVIQADSHVEAKYILYAGKNKAVSIIIPISKTGLRAAVSGYEKYLDSIVKRIERDFKKTFPESKNLNSTIN
ncbi:MAG: hypothetical protein K8H86_08875, partial [Ignavibacteriaceae bacterium]|nr:hypothetical protein [Ignavibacteriaceae bacterium]